MSMKGLQFGSRTVRALALLIAHVTSSPSIALQRCVTIHECIIFHPYEEDVHYWLLAHCSVVKEPVSPASWREWRNPFGILQLLSFCQETQT
jgi:hypothetical protein